MHPCHIRKQGRQVQKPAYLGPGNKQVPQGLTLDYPFGYQYLAPPIQTKVTLVPKQWNATGNPEFFQQTQPIKLTLYAETRSQTATPNSQPSSVQFDGGLLSVCEDFAPD
jgi:hypothetical protein